MDIEQRDEVRHELAVLEGSYQEHQILDKTQGQHYHLQEHDLHHPALLAVVIDKDGQHDKEHGDQASGIMRNSFYGVHFLYVLTKTRCKDNYLEGKF